MPPGKLAAQAGHAFIGALEATPTERRLSYHKDPPGTKIVLAAPTVDHLLWASGELSCLDLGQFLVEDSGHILPPHFDGNPIITALGFGPATRDEVRRITRRFDLVA